METNVKFSKKHEREEKELPHTFTCSQVSPTVRGPCSFRMSNMTLVIVCVCSGGVLSSIGFMGGFGFFARYFIAVANIVNFLSLDYFSPTK